MADNLKDLLRLWRLYARMDLLWLTQDFSSALLVMLSETLGSLSGMAGVLLLAVRFGGVGGLSADEILFMLGFFELANGLSWILLGNYNVIHISRRIARGQLDHMLLQPRPLWLQLVTEGFMPFSGCQSIHGAVFLTPPRIDSRYTLRRDIIVGKHDDPSSFFPVLPADRLCQPDSFLQIRPATAARKTEDRPARILPIRAAGYNLPDFFFGCQYSDLLAGGHPIQHLQRPLFRGFQPCPTLCHRLHAAAQVKNHHRPGCVTAFQAGMHQAQYQQQRSQELHRQQQVFPQALERPVGRVILHGRLPQERARYLGRQVFPAQQVQNHDPGRQGQCPGKLRGCK